MMSRCALGLFIGFLGGCGAPDAGAPSPPVTVANVVDRGSAAPVESAAPSASKPDAVAVDAGWVHERPELTRLFAGVRACAKTESFTGSFNAAEGTIHGYSLYAPGVDQETLERGFRKEASALGYSVTDGVTGRGFWDQQKGQSAYLTDARIDVVFNVPGRPEKVAGPLATALGFETWPMLAALADATWAQLRLDQYIAGVSLTGSLKVGAAGRAEFERWALQHQMAKDGETWVQKWQPTPTPRAGIAITLEANGQVSILESIGEQVTGGVCKGSPKRKAEDAANQPPPSKETDDDLMKQMTGK